MFGSNFTTSAGSMTAWAETGKKIPEVKTMKEWAKHSKDNPHFGLTVDWLPHPNGENLGQVINDIKQAVGAVDEKALVANRKKVSPATLKTVLTGNVSGVRRL
jgi:hypothetical protein